MNEAFGAELQHYETLGDDAPLRLIMLCASVSGGALCWVEMPSAGHAEMNQLNVFAEEFNLFLLQGSAVDAECQTDLTLAFYIQLLTHYFLYLDFWTSLTLLERHFSTVTCFCCYQPL